MQGVGTRMKSGNEKFFISRNQVPTGQKITYANPVCDYRPRKDNPYHVRLIIVGEMFPYLSDLGYPAATLLEAKINYDGVILTPCYQFICADIKDHFLCSPM